jgi:uncharacterized membrane protein YhhN
VTDPGSRGPRSTIYRWMSAVLGAVLIACAALIVALVPFSDWPAMIAAGVLFALGADALVAAKDGRWSMLSRIGPLP